MQLLLMGEASSVVLTIATMIEWSGNISLNLYRQMRIHQKYESFCHIGIVGWRFMAASPEGVVPELLQRLEYYRSKI